MMVMIMMIMMIMMLIHPRQPERPLCAGSLRPHSRLEGSHGPGPWDGARAPVMVFDVLRRRAPLCIRWLGERRK